jgi:type IV pilus assembly protein PilN
MAFPKKCIAIDIGNHQIKIAELERTRNQAKVIHFAMVPTPKNCLNDGLIVNKEEISNIIKSALKTSRMKSKEVIFTLASSKIITREVEFPNLKPSKLSTIIKMNASEYFPVNLDDYILDHYIIDTVEDEGEKLLKVNIIAALSELIEDYVSLARLCDLKPAGIDYSGISLASFAVKDGLGDGVNILLDVGSNSTMVSIIDNNVMKFNRNLLYGSSLLIDSIKNHFEVDEEEALRISLERSLFDNENIDNPYLSNDMTGAINQILTGIGRLIDYYSSRNQGKLERIYLVGGGANIHGLAEYI